MEIVTAVCKVCGGSWHIRFHGMGKIKGSPIKKSDKVSVMTPCKHMAVILPAFGHNTYIAYPTGVDYTGKVLSQQGSNDETVRDS